MCSNKKKCNWCKKRKLKEEVWEIKIWCKWYGKTICETCYDKKWH
jgi:hypothetical protein